MSSHHFVTKANPTIITPQARQIDERKSLGPIFRVRSVAGGWKIVYVTKKTRATMD